MSRRVARRGLVAGLVFLLAASSASVAAFGQQKSNPAADSKEQLAKAKSLLDEAKLHYAKGQFAEAEKIDRQVLEIHRKVLGEEHAGTALGYHNVASDLLALGRLAEAETHFRKALEIRLKVAGEAHTATAATYQNLAVTLDGQGKFAAAEEMARHALEIYRKLNGEEHANTARSYSQLSHAVASQGKYAAAEPLDRKALEIRRKLYGEEHAETAIGYFNLARDLSGLQKLSEAEPVHRKALEIRRKVLGEEHGQTVLSFSSLAKVLYEQGKYADAEPLERKLLEIRRKSLGEENPLTALSFSTLAKVLHQQGKYAEAEPLDRKALNIRRKVQGEENPDTVHSMINLGADLRGLGLYAGAEKLDRQALEAYRKLHGEDHAKTALAYDNLAGDLQAQGRFAAAEAIHRKVLEIHRKISGEEALSTIFCYHNLAGDLQQQGQYAAAEQLDRKALALFQKVVGEMSLHTARSYGSLAGDLRMQGDFAEAEKLQRKALDIRKKLLGDWHPDTARTYSNLATDLHKQKKYGEAEQLGRKALEIRLKALGEEHPEVASSYNNFAVLLYEQGKAAEAETYMRKALEIDRKLLGEDHPKTALSYFSLAITLYSQGNLKEAERQGLAGARSYQAARLGISFSGLGRASFGAQQSPLQLLAVVLARNGKPAQAWQYLEEDLGRGLFDDLAALGSRQLTDQERQLEQSLQAKLASIEKQFQRENKVDGQQLAALKRQHDQLMTQFSELQAALQKKYSVAAGEVYNLDKIQAALPENAALIGWLDLGTDHWGFVVRRQGVPKWVKLKGSGADDQWRKEDSDLPGKLREVLQFPDPNTDWRSWRDDLARQRLRPLTEHLDGVKHVIVLPSGSMAGIPVDVLSERYEVSYVPSGTMYAWLQANRKEPGKGPVRLLAVADPVFSKEQTELALPPKVAKRLLVRGALKPLPGTRGEAGAIAKLFGKGNVELLMGAQANGANLDRLAQEKKLGEFRYLHLATHGFADAKGGLNSFLALTPENLATASYDKLSASHILRTWKLNADLVTLSACTTALGEYQGGEGYIGFSQALFLAGAHTVVVSQWPVHDLSTTLLMQRFYQNVLGARKELKSPLTKVAALSEAQRWLKELTREEVQQRLKELGITASIDDLAGERPFEHPNFWAPFILVGDPGR